MVTAICPLATKNLYLITRATGVPREKPLGERERTSNKQIYTGLLIDHLQFPCPEPRSQWIKLSTELLTHLP